MALFQKKITFDDLLKAAAALSDEEKKKLRETLEEKPEDAQAEEKEEAESEVSPDQMITCPKCHKRFRVGKKQG